MLESLLESFLRCGDVKSAREVVEMCSSKELYNISFLFGEYFTEVFNEIPKVGEHITEQQNKAKQLIKRIIERIPIYVTKTK
jgi:hypothetical protein